MNSTFLFFGQDGRKRHTRANYRPAQAAIYRELGYAPWLEQTLRLGASVEPAFAYHRTLISRQRSPDAQIPYQRTCNRSLKLRQRREVAYSHHPPKPPKGVRHSRLSAVLTSTRAATASRSVPPPTHTPDVELSRSRADGRQTYLVLRLSLIWS